MQIISRDEWGAAPPKGSLDGWPAGQPSSWTLHYEGVDVDVNEGDYAPRVRAIQSYHQTHGYSDIAYNWVVSPSGQIFEGRGWDYRSAAQVSGNPVSIAICYIGGPSTELTDAAKASINALIATNPMEVLPHRYWFATACPGDQLVEWIDAGRPATSSTPFLAVVPTVSTPDARPMVRPGARGAAVVEMQDRLKAHGFDCGPSDGIYGPNTGNALRSFQGHVGIASDGICGPITWERLNRTPNTVPAPSGSTRLLRRGDRGADVAEVQEALYRAGHDPGPGDGVFGNRTEIAVCEFQQERGLDVDGIVGPQTRAALGI